MSNTFMRWCVALALVASVGCSSGAAPTAPATAATPVADPIRAITFTGVLTDSDTGAPLEGATVTYASYSAVSGANGVYSFTLPPSEPPPIGSYSCPHARKDGYESRQACVRVDLQNWRVSWSPVLHRRVSIDAGQAFTATVVPGDGYGIVMEDYQCDRCRIVRINVPDAGTLSFQLTSESLGASLALELLYPYRSLPLDGVLDVSSKGEVLLAVIGRSAPVKVTLATTFTRR